MVAITIRASRIAISIIICTSTILTVAGAGAGVGAWICPRMRASSSSEFI